MSRFWRRLETAPAVRLAKRRVRQLLGRELWHFTDVRLTTESHGTWSVVPAGLSAESVVYSMGVGEDLSLDLALIERFGFPVHAFDPTPMATNWVEGQTLPPQLHFHRIGIADYDGTAEFRAPGAAGGRSCYTMAAACAHRDERIHAEVRRLDTLRASLGHDRIDLLKLDVEGAEYAVIDDLLRSGIPVTQILVEFHHRFKSIGREKTDRAVKALRAAGYRIFYISPSGREYGFIRAESFVRSAAGELGAEGKAA